MGHSIEVLTARNIREIETVFTSLEQKQADALFVGPSVLFTDVACFSLSRRTTMKCLREVANHSQLNQEPRTRRSSLDCTVEFGEDMHVFCMISLAAGMHASGI